MRWVWRVWRNGACAECGACGVCGACDAMAHALGVARTARVVHALGVRVWRNGACAWCGAMEHVLHLRSSKCNFLTHFKNGRGKKKEGQNVPKDSKSRGGTMSPKTLLMSLQYYKYITYSRGGVCHSEQSRRRTYPRQFFLCFSHFLLQLGYPLINHMVTGLNIMSGLINITFTA